MVSKGLLVAIVFLFLVGLVACSVLVNVKHPQLVVADSEHAASVYFIRPSLYKSKGIADNTLRINYKRRWLLDIAEGQYALLKIQASRGVLSTHSITTFTNQHVPIDVSRSRRYKFLPGQTYFVHIKQINEEFRGVYYEPSPVTLIQAKKLIEQARPFGAALTKPINTLTEISAPPAPGALEPVLPESLYR